MKLKNKYILEYNKFDNALKVPNGKKSNLTKKQWYQVRTPEFKAWFGDWENDPQNASKVLDENGEPLVVYHGSYDYGFTKFNKKLRGNTTSAKSAKKGFFFTDNKDLADYYARRSASGGIYSVFLNIKKPNIKDFKSEPVDTDKVLTKLIDYYDYDGAIALNLKDGFRIDNQYIAFQPNQIKSATDNNGDFNPNNENITK
jgi:hypothetical protein